jgi:hypothetical protein
MTGAASAKHRGPNKRSVRWLGWKHRGPNRRSVRCWGGNTGCLANGGVRLLGWKLLKPRFKMGSRVSRNFDDSNVDRALLKIFSPLCTSPVAMTNFLS